MKWNDLWWMIPGVILLGMLVAALPWLAFGTADLILGK